MSVTKSTHLTHTFSASLRFEYNCSELLLSLKGKQLYFTAKKASNSPNTNPTIPTVREMATAVDVCMELSEEAEEEAENPNAS